MDTRYYRATNVGLWRAAYFCLLAVFAPAAFERKNTEDGKRLNELIQGRQPEPSSYVIRRAFWLSLIAVLFSALFGYLAGLASTPLLSCVPEPTILALQVLGVCLLLWGTLFVRGWQIQTYKGLSLAERVNQWIYRALYCAGTAIIVCSIAVSPCYQ